jgi:hypothetical protein
MREILLKARSLTGLQDGWVLGGVIIQPLLILIGVLVFTRFERPAMRRGTLGRY